MALASIVMALLGTGGAWLTIWPILKSLMSLPGGMPGLIDPQVHRWEQLVPFLIGLDLVVATAAIFLMLYVSLGIPLTRVEAAIEQVASDNVLGGSSGGPLVSRLNQALRRLTTDLGEERARSAAQVAELERRNAELVRLQTELVGADRLATVGKLAAGVAHEVGNPLAGILGYLSVIRMRAKGNAELFEVVDRIEHEVQRIDQTVRALLELGRPSRGKAQPVDVRPIVDSCVQLLSAGREFREVTVGVEVPGSFWLRAEVGPLSQVLVNLLINAAQAMGGKGRVTVRAGEDGGLGFISVEDEGPGLPPDVLSRLFEPFFTTKPAGKGTGLGLAVSRHLLSQFEGTLEAGNRPTGGAVFTIHLPKP